MWKISTIEDDDFFESQDKYFQSMILEEWREFVQYQRMHNHAIHKNIESILFLGTLISVSFLVLILNSWFMVGMMRSRNGWKSTALRNRSERKIDCSYESKDFAEGHVGDADEDEAPSVGITPREAFRYRHCCTCQSSTVQGLRPAVAQGDVQWTPNNFKGGSGSCVANLDSRFQCCKEYAYKSESSLCPKNGSESYPKRASPSQPQSTYWKYARQNLSGFFTTLIILLVLEWILLGGEPEGLILNQSHFETLVLYYNQFKGAVETVYSMILLWSDKVTPTLMSMSHCAITGRFAQLHAVKHWVSSTHLPAFLNWFYSALLPGLHSVLYRAKYSMWSQAYSFMCWLHLCGPPALQHIFTQLSSGFFVLSSWCCWLWYAVYNGSINLFQFTSQVISWCCSQCTWLCYVVSNGAINLFLFTSHTYGNFCMHLAVFSSFIYSLLLVVFEVVFGLCFQIQTLVTTTFSLITQVYGQKLVFWFSGHQLLGNTALFGAKCCFLSQICGILYLSLLFILSWPVLFFSVILLLSTMVTLYTYLVPWQVQTSN